MEQETVVAPTSLIIPSVVAATNLLNLLNSSMALLQTGSITEAQLQNMWASMGLSLKAEEKAWSQVSGG